MLKKISTIILFVTFAFLVVSCGDSKEKGNENNSEKKTDTIAKKEISNEDILLGKLELFILNDFFPTDIFKKLNEAGSKYNSMFMNPVSNAENYTSSNTKAFCLGVYGADLNYSICYDKASDAMTYLVTAKKIAEEINIPMAFDEELIKAYQENINQKDQLSILIIDAYDKASEMLKSIEQIEMSVLVIAGGWFEGLYLALNSYKEDNEDLNSFLTQQASKLEKIMEIIELFPDDAYVSSIKIGFEKISTFIIENNNNYNTKTVKILKSILEETREEII